VFRLFNYVPFQVNLLNGRNNGERQHDRRRIVHFAVTAHPTAEWTAQQMREAFPWDTAPRYLLRDRDRIFGTDFVDQVEAMGIKQVLSAPRSPWQRAYVERVVGTIRRECLDLSIS
jgi:putative transposase